METHELEQTKDNTNKYTDICGSRTDRINSKPQKQGTAKRKKGNEGNDQTRMEISASAHHSKS